MSIWMILTYICAIGFGAFLVVLTVIVTIGGVFDLKYFFKSLDEEILDETDDGRVVHK